MEQRYVRPSLSRVLIFIGGLALTGLPVAGLLTLLDWVGLHLGLAPITGSLFLDSLLWFLGPTLLLTAPLLSYLFLRQFSCPWTYDQTKVTVVHEGRHLSFRWDEIESIADRSMSLRVQASGLSGGAYFFFAHPRDREAFLKTFELRRNPSNH
ncbi:MAG: hypothetical protein AAF517_09010 [Planctomycetota bacterium]